MFIVLPDLGETKYRALARLGSAGMPVDVLISYTTLKWKPSAYRRIQELRRRGLVRGVMLDSGAYHIMRLGEEVDLEDYSRIASEGPWTFVVAPDVPGDPPATLERTARFSVIYEGRFVPVIQGGQMEEYAENMRALWSLGLLDRAPVAGDGRPLVGIGGLDGRKKRTNFVSSLISTLAREARELGLDPTFHLFGIGVRVLKGLARRGLLRYIYSVDSSGWLAEIQWRRRTVYNANTPLEANLKAIEAYIAKAEAAVSA